MRVISIVGARPQFIKVAPISWRAEGICEHQIVNTGQHYDPELSGDFFAELAIPEPVKNLYSGSGSHGAQTARILVGVEQVLLDLRPDWVLVYGDTNSTIAAALAAAKIGIKVGHIEAGLRSFNREMPEEINRIGTDHLSNLLFAPTHEAMANLKKEGLDSKSLLVGDVMVETLSRIKTKILTKSPEQQMQIFATIHRAENTNSKERLLQIVNNLAASPLPINLYAHPRLIHKAREFGVDLQRGSIRVHKPAGYFETITGVLESVGVITDSGGLQKEAYLLERPCLTVRGETEWIETCVEGWNQLDPNLRKVDTKWWESNRAPVNPTLYGDGSASKRILEALESYSY